MIELINILKVLNNRSTHLTKDIDDNNIIYTYHNISEHGSTISVKVIVHCSVLAHANNGIHSAKRVTCLLTDVPTNISTVYNSFALNKKDDEESLQELVKIIEKQLIDCVALYQESTVTAFKKAVGIGD